MQRTQALRCSDLILIKHTSEYSHFASFNFFLQIQFSSETIVITSGIALICVWSASFPPFWMHQFAETRNVVKSILPQLHVFESHKTKSRITSLIDEEIGFRIKRQLAVFFSTFIPKNNGTEKMILFHFIEHKILSPKKNENCLSLFSI